MGLGRICYVSAPNEAWVSDQDGWDDFQHLIQESYQWLRPNGFLLLEHGYDQKEPITSFFKQHGYQKINTWQDYQ